MKSLLVTYFCWLVGGFFGLHHFYLGRDKHAFITFATFGGYFTLGLIRDLWRIPEYVKDANNDLDYLKSLHAQIKKHKRPPSSLVRQSGLMMVGNLFAYLVGYAIPAELCPNATLLAIVKFLLIPLGSAFGVWLAGNVGRHRGGITKPLVAAYVCAIPSLFMDVQTGSFSTLAAMLVFTRYCKEWRLVKERPKPLHRRLALALICITIYLSLWSSWLYFSCTVEDPETLEPIKCRVALENFINSPAYTNLSQALFLLYEHIRHSGFSGLWREIMQEFDVSGKTNALQTLELDDNASPQEIIAQYKKLSRLYHPDREKDESKKAEKHEKFIQVQEAYRKLEATVHRYKQEQMQASSPSSEHEEL